ncbi:BCTnown [Vibrio crassostreae]|nr:BCTnown [Vibrio crassostreae]CAK3013887.1 BCTnown [Vibrio crassostreae]CAK3014092.1 BCTnown [Vibrio crassostreae]CAK3016051.1 BCTnown [Vibrio crassostreae]CAK3016634.1 BCTnown [Vibrio crassostreae]
MKYLSHYIQDKQTQAFNEAGAFFAFSNKQFDEAKKEGVKYASLGMSLICPVDNTKQLMTRLDSIAQEGIAEDIEENGKKAIIRRELFNHECFYTNDICDCVEKLEGYGIFYDEVYEVFNHIRKTEDVY